MKKWLIVLFSALTLSACSNTQTIIDWVDFIKVGDHTYYSVDSLEIADVSLISNQVDKVKFKVADVVKNTGYKTKAGDAAFHEIGTKIYEIKGQPNFLAVQVENTVNGYRIYCDRDLEEKCRFWFSDMPQDQVTKVDIIQELDSLEKKTLRTLETADEISELFSFLNNGKVNAEYTPDSNRNGETIDYKMVFYMVDGPFAYQFRMMKSGETYFWSPYSTEIVEPKVGKFFEGQ